MDAGFHVQRNTEPADSSFTDYRICGGEPCGRCSGSRRAHAFGGAGGGADASEPILRMYSGDSAQSSACELCRRHDHSCNGKIFDRRANRFENNNLFIEIAPLNPSTDQIEEIALNFVLCTHSAR